MYWIFRITIIFQTKKKILLKKAQKGAVINDQLWRANIF